MEGSVDTLVALGVGPLLIGDNRDNVRVCFEPENTVLLEDFWWPNNAFLRDISCCIHALDPSPSSSLSILGNVVCKGCNCVTLLASFFFFLASCWAHCLFNLFKSASAFNNSSLSSRTRRSCVATAVRKLVSVGPVGEGTDSGATGCASRTGD